MQNKLFSVKNKKILITGASAGLGKHYAQVLAEAGAHIIACARREELLNDLVQEIKNKKGSIQSLVLDVTDFSDAEKKLTQLYSQLEGIDVLINNAGTTAKVKRPVIDITLEDWDDVMDTNLKSMWHISNITAKYMQKFSIKGSIINISSTAANRARAGNPIYGISKSAVIALTEKLAGEYAHYNIRVNSIAPGFFETDINKSFVQSEGGKEFLARTIPLGRKGEYEELEGAIFLFSSNASSYITGECLFVDGGYIINSLI
ncbi:SDR family NAD(P)-dependent oxidoreductase [Fluviispira sanaruensis]|uniref:3-oxoacyl-ACP reductase n=1 Tax=Fluviispira sanaruensis TaxID=2493639 RepID=A0A4P2VW31_FLUSA|nr:SDR family NAD(P)-dependent oxidoreductase [Fluviispira sanaruensis]BBH53152.1 3-oxoacyl-ACP reductase [Fluviispira sanaruensis]